MEEKRNACKSAGFQYDRNTELGILRGVIDSAVRSAITACYLREQINIMIDEHDVLYYCMDQPELVNAPYPKYRGTDMAYWVATLESVKEWTSLTLYVIRKTPLHGIDNSMEVDRLIKHAVEPAIKMKFIVMDRGYIDAGVMENVNRMNLQYITPAKENSNVKSFDNIKIEYSKRLSASFLILEDTIS